MKRISWLCLCVLWVACKDKIHTQTINSPAISTYFPLKSGKYITYIVDSTSYNNFYSPPKITQAHYYIKYQVADSFYDGAGQLNYRVEVYRSNTDSVGSWQIIDVDFATANSTSAQFVDDNLRYIKLTAPINYYTQWYGNAFINTDTSGLGFLNNWNYKYQNIGQAATLNGITYANTLMIKQIDTSNAIEKTVGYEQYAAGVGLVYREFSHLDNFNSDSIPPANVPWPARATDGFIITMTANGHN